MNNRMLSWMYRVQFTITTAIAMTALLLVAMVNLKPEVAIGSATIQASCGSEVCSVYLPMVPAECPGGQNQCAPSGGATEPTETTDEVGNESTNQTPGSDEDPGSSETPSIPDAEPTAAPPGGTPPTDNPNDAPATEVPAPDEEPADTQPIVPDDENDGSTAPTASIPPPEALLGDLGDAPQSASSVITMSAYTSGTVANVPAFFPTIYVPGVPSGPFHHSHGPSVTLGEYRSIEANAHLLPDEDGTANINQEADMADLDGADDGFLGITGLEEPCATVVLTTTVLLHGGTPVEDTDAAFLNVWVDSNRDGDFDDSVQCGNNQGVYVDVDEHVVDNLWVDLEPGVMQTIVVSFTNPMTGTKLFEQAWLRMTVSNFRDVPILLDDGRYVPAGSGPAEGYRFGETEDRRLWYDVPGTDDRRATWR